MRGLLRRGEAIRTPNSTENLLRSEREVVLVAFAEDNDWSVLFSFMALIRHSQISPRIDKHTYKKFSLPPTSCNRRWDPKSWNDWP